MGESNYERIGRILSAIDDANTARRTSDIIGELGLAQTTGFGLIRAMVRLGLLERVDHGWVRLGPHIRNIGFFPVQAGRNRRPKSYVVAVPREKAVSTSLSDSLTDNWDDMLTEYVDTSPFRRSRPCRIGFLNASTSNPWRRALVASVSYGISIHKRDVSSFLIYSAEDDSQKQSQQLQSLLDSGVDGLIVSAADGTDAEFSRRLEELVASGLPVVAVDRRPFSAGSFTSYVSASDEHIGQITALWLAETLKGVGRVWLLCGLDRALPAVVRLNSALKIFQRFPGINVEAVTYTGWTEAGGRQAVTELLRRLDAPDGVWCDSGLQGVGSIKCFMESSKTIPPHTGGDLNEVYQLALTNKIPFVAVDYPAAMGARAVDALMGLFFGAVTTRKMEVPIRTIIPRGHETQSVKADEWAETHVKWGHAANLILSQGPSLSFGKTYRADKR